MPRRRNADDSARSDGCPHLDRNDARCGSRFRLGGIDQAFDVCLGSFHGCVMYHRLNRELAADARRGATPAIATVAVTAHGHAVALRPTGS